MKKMLLFSFCLIVLFQQNSTAQWIPSNNGINNVKTISVNSIITNGNNVIAAFDNGSIYKSSNNGETWDLKVINGLTKGIRSLTLNGSNIFASGDNETGIYLSTDNGETWTPKVNGLNSKSVFAVASLNNRLFAATTSGVYVSTNNGDTWQIKSIGLNSMWSYNIAFIGEKVFVATSGGISMSDNYGEIWFTKNNGLLSSRITEITSNGNDLYAGTLDSGVYHSSDFGETWVLKSNGLTSQSIWSIKAFDNYVVAGTGRFIKKGNGIFISKDYANNWVSSNSGIPIDELYNEPVIVPAISFNKDYIFVGTSKNGVFKAKLEDLGITGVEIENKFDNNLVISPNPVSDFLSIRSDFIDWKAEIYTIYGIKILETNINERINVGNLATGVYFLKVISGENTKNMKFEIIR